MVAAGVSLRAMLSRTCLLAALLAPCVALAQETAPAIDPASIAGDAAPLSIDARSFDLRDTNVRRIVRDTASTQGTGVTAEQFFVLEDVVEAGLRSAAGQCSGFDCFAGLHDSWASFFYPHDYSGLIYFDEYQYDAWLRCQQLDDMLSTFERYQRCDRYYEPSRRVTATRIRLEPLDPQPDSGAGQQSSKARDFALKIANALQQSQRDREPAGVELESVPQATGGSSQGDDVRTELKSAVGRALRR
jgi:hypothetical protein